MHEPIVDTSDLHAPSVTLPNNLSILQVSTGDLGGGAEKIAVDLHRSYRKRGFDSRLAVGRKTGQDPDVIAVPNDDHRSSWAKLWLQAGKKTSVLENRVRGATRMRRAIEWIGQPGRWFQIRSGAEDFDYPGTSHVLSLMPVRPSIVHCHNLHGGYFDLNFLSDLSKEVPLVLTLHDAWLLSGHCAHSFDCDRWMTGCGNCPDLATYPAIPKDATAANWRRKSEIYARSSFHVATPCRWLMNKVERSMLSKGIHSSRVIPYGIDLKIFRPGNGLKARESLSLPKDAFIVLFVGNATVSNIYKDYPMLEKAVIEAARAISPRPLVLICLGQAMATKREANLEIRYLAKELDPSIVAEWYRSADICVNPARAETFGSTVLEAAACGVPVIGTAVGGIPEQILPLGGLGATDQTTSSYDIDDATGVLVAPGDAESMTAALVALLNDESIRTKIGANAARHAQKHFDLERHASDYLDWYAELLNTRPVATTASP